MHTGPMHHPRCTRRVALQAGTVGLLGLGMNHLAALRTCTAAPSPRSRAVIYVFLSGGLSQLDSFDLKPDAPENIRGEFRPIATRTPGLRICEHLPLLAQRSERWALVRSLTHSTNGHSEGHMMMLSGRSELPPGFSGNRPQGSDWPSIAAVAGYATQPRNNLPPAVVLPEKLIHTTGRVIPGPFAGLLGNRHEPWLIEVSPFDSQSYGAYPQYTFDHQERPFPRQRLFFELPNLSLPDDLNRGRFDARRSLLKQIDAQRRTLDRGAATERLDDYRQAAVSLLTGGQVRKAFDLNHEEPRVLDRYGRNAFGWSLLMARRLVEAGVNLVQVNLGNNETWDTHGNAFPHLKDSLFPPLDHALSGLLDDLHDSGLLDSTMIVMASEFGRTPKISTLPQFYKLPGRDHWGAVQTVFFAGGGIQGGTIVGSSDATGGYPASEPHTPENLAATIYHALGIPATAHWRDTLERPHAVYHGEPIGRLLT
jgi:hypothetical protein